MQGVLRHKGVSFRRAAQTCAIAAALQLSSLKPSSAAFGNSLNTSQLSSKSACVRTFSTSARKKLPISLENPTKARKSETTRTIMSASDSADEESSSFSVVQFPCLNDNYGFLLHDEKTGDTAAIDTPCAETYCRELQKRGWNLTHIFNTHHHWDHSGGNAELKKAGNNVKIFGPVKEKHKIPEIDVPVGAGERVSFGGCQADVLDVGGHTMGHIAYYFPREKKVFVGDSLFVMGCGRMFEGTPKQFWSTLETLRSLPDETTVYCAHEYTESNAKFAVSVEPGNKDLQFCFEHVKQRRSRGEPTVPTTIGQEKKTNPFLRVDVSDEIRKNIGAEDGDSSADIFAKVRHAKDTFRG